MRPIICLLVLLSACASHDVRCDGRLQRINHAAANAPVSAPPAPLPAAGRGDP